MGDLTSNILDAKPTYKFPKIQDQLKFPLCAELSLTVFDIIITSLFERPSRSELRRSFQFRCGCSMAQVGEPPPLWGTFRTFPSRLCIGK